MLTHRCSRGKRWWEHRRKRVDGRWNRHRLTRYWRDRVSFAWCDLILLRDGFRGCGSWQCLFRFRLTRNMCLGWKISASGHFDMDRFWHMHDTRTGFRDLWGSVLLEVRWQLLGLGPRVTGLTQFLPTSSRWSDIIIYEVMEHTFSWISSISGRDTFDRTRGLRCCALIELVQDNPVEEFQKRRQGQGQP